MAKIFLVVVLVFTFSSYCQRLPHVKEHLSSKEALDSVINNLITTEYYVNAKEELRVIFTFKIDSLGEIHSAHIRRSTNLKDDSYYEICHKIEKDVMAQFLYEKFRDDAVIQKYVLVDYPFTSRK